MNADGSGQTRLTQTNVNARNVQPTWSPDGTQIAFQSNRDGNNQIYVMNADGTNLTRLTSDSAADAQPAWSAASGSPPNQPPVATFTSSCSGLTCTFTSTSSDPDGSIVAYSWTFGDSGTSTVANPSHAYGSAGTYAVTLTVTDNQRATDSVSDSVTVSVPSVAGKIAFTSNRDGNNEIYVMNADGTGVTRLTNNPAADGQPAWSPDGSRVVFTSNRDGNNELYVMNADGTGVTRLTDNPALDVTPAWSPDGSRIVFVSERDGNDEIYVMNADASAVTRLTSNPTWDGEPAWSPDGSRLAFVSNRGGTLDVYVMNADGTGVAQLTTGWSADPAWSPDGGRIAFKGYTDGSHEIYVMNADGTGVTRLTNVAGTDETPVWSPDGSRIAFGSERDGDLEIYVMNADGTGVTQLTSNTFADAQPAWFGAAVPGATVTGTWSVGGVTSGCGLTFAAEPPVRAPMPERRRLLPLPFVQPRQVVVRVREPSVHGQRPPVRVDRVGRAAQVLERDPQVERGRCMLGVGRERLAIMPLRLDHAILLVQQPAQVHVRVGVVGVQLERPAVGVARLLGVHRLELEAHLVPV
jgi:Tol biopolymer transport system component